MATLSIDPVIADLDAVVARASVAPKLPSAQRVCFPPP